MKLKIPLHRVSDCRGAILLEVVLALVLFAAAAAVLTSALNSSLESVQRQKRELHAANLATSLLAEIQMGARTPEAREAFALDHPFEEWTAEIISSTAETSIGEGSALNRVEVVVRHKNSSTVYRLGQNLNLARMENLPSSGRVDLSLP
jgi:Tfp pilus assembly protein PilV